MEEKRVTRKDRIKQQEFENIKQVEAMIDSGEITSLQDDIDEMNESKDSDE